MTAPAVCPLCTASADQQFPVVSRVYGDDQRAVFRCGNCDVRYLHPGLTPEEEAKLYAAEFEPFMAKRSAPGTGWEGPEKHVAGSEAQRVRRMSRLAPLLKPKNRILEFGCSSGFMLYPLQAAGHECTGIEPSGVFRDYVQSRRVTCYRNLEEYSAASESSAGFDLILHYYVMEHIADPIGLIRQQLALLTPSGRIVVEVPNANDALTTIYKIPAYELFIWVVSHRWYFTEQSLAYVMTQAGSKGEVHLDQRYDLSNHLVWARDGKPGGMGRFTPILGEEIENQYREALIRARRCDTLIGIFHN
jgi:SAM-dependent methyltransferase